MSVEQFQSVPVPSQFVLRVMSAVTQWAAEESPEATPAGQNDNGTWPADLLVKIVNDKKRKSLRILTKMLDHLAKKPGRYLPSKAIAAAISEPPGSVTRALQELRGLFTSEYGRTDFPYVREDHAYGLTAVQAKAWMDARAGVN